MRGDITSARIYFSGSKTLSLQIWISDQWQILALGLYLPLHLSSFTCIVSILCTKGTKIEVMLSLCNLVFSELLEVQRSWSCLLVHTSEGLGVCPVLPWTPIPSCCCHRWVWTLGEPHPSLSWPSLAFHPYILFLMKAFHGMGSCRHSC